MARINRAGHIEQPFQVVCDDFFGCFRTELEVWCRCQACRKPTPPVFAGDQHGLCRFIAGPVLGADVISGRQF